MMNIAITTTDSINGYTIKDYYGLISARVVVGVSLVSEFFAGFSDVFGGRSKQFEGELGDLYNSALKQLIERLKETHGNAIIGVKMDMDQISAKNTLMFMINVYGTAVRLERDNSQKQEQIIIDQRKFVNGKKIERRFLSEKVSYSDFNKLLGESLNYDLVSIPLLLNTMNRCRGNEFHESDYNASLVIMSEYLNNFEGKEIFKEVSKYLIKNWSELKADIREFLLGIMKTASDYEPADLIYIMSRLPETIWPRSILPVIIDMRHKYTVEEANQLEQIVEMINKQPPINTVVVTGMFGSKQEKCRCGGVIVGEKCQVCYKDRYGFLELDSNMLEEAREVIALTYEWIKLEANR